MYYTCRVPGVRWLGKLSVQDVNTFLTYTASQTLLVDIRAPANFPSRV